MRDSIKLIGHLKATVIRADGSSYVHHDEKNTINQEVLDALATDMLAGATNTFGMRSSSYPSDNSTIGSAEDGIAIKSASGDSPANTWYGLTIVTSTPASDKVKLTGTFTGVAVTIDGTTKVELGRNWSTSSFVVTFATPTSWSSLTITALDTLKIEWTVEFK